MTINGTIERTTGSLTRLRGQLIEAHVMEKHIRVWDADAAAPVSEPAQRAQTALSFAETAARVVGNTRVSSLKDKLLVN